MPGCLDECVMSQEQADQEKGFSSPNGRSLNAVGAAGRRSIRADGTWSPSSGRALARILRPLEGLSNVVDPTHFRARLPAEARGHRLRAEPIRVHPWVSVA